MQPVNLSKELWRSQIREHFDDTEAFQHQILPEAKMNAINAHES